MAETPGTVGGWTEARRTGSLIASISFFIAAFLYYVFLQGYVPQQLDIVVLVGLACVTYIIGIYSFEHFASGKGPDDERKNKFRRDLRIAGTLFAGLCLLFALNAVAIILNVTVSSYANIGLVLILLIFTMYLTKAKRE